MNSYAYSSVIWYWYDILLVELNTINKTLENINKELEMCSNLLYHGLYSFGVFKIISTLRQWIIENEG